MAASLRAIAFYEGDSAKAIQKFKDKGVEIYPLPKEELAKLEKLAGQYCIMKAKESKAYAEVLKSQMEYLSQYKEWRDMSGDFGFGRTPTYVDNVLAELKKMGY